MTVWSTYRKSHNNFRYISSSLFPSYSPWSRCIGKMFANMTVWSTYRKSHNNFGYISSSLFHSYSSGGYCIGKMFVYMTVWSTYRKSNYIFGYISSSLFHSYSSGGYCIGKIFVYMTVWSTYRKSHYIFGYLITIHFAISSWSLTFTDQVLLLRLLVLDNLLHQLVVAAFAHGLDIVLVLRVHQPAVVQPDLQQVEDNAF